MVIFLPKLLRAVREVDRQTISCDKAGRAQSRKHAILFAAKLRFFSDNANMDFVDFFAKSTISQFCLFLFYL